MQVAFSERLFHYVYITQYKGHFSSFLVQPHCSVTLHLVPNVTAPVFLRTAPSTAILTCFICGVLWGWWFLVARIKVAHSSQRASWT